MKLKNRDTSSLLGQLARAALGEHPAFSANPLGDWAELAGEQVARYSQPVSLKKKVLLIVAHDSVWKHCLEMERETLLTKINHHRPETLVDKIVIKVGMVPEALPVLNPSKQELEKTGKKRYRPRKLVKNPARKLTPEDKEFIRRLHPDLKKVAERLLKKMPDDSEAS
jgi:hypothetical protein